MRLFVALYPPPEVVTHVGAYADRLRIGQAAADGVNVRRASADNLHVTLAFIGDVDDGRLPDVRDALDRAAQGWRTPSRRRGTRTRRPTRPAEPPGPAELSRPTEWSCPVEPARPAEPVVPEPGAEADPVVSDPVVSEAVAAEAGVVPVLARLRLAGGGRFGRGRFTVLWVGLDGDVDALALVSDAVRTELTRARVPYDRRPLRPHLTLARPGERLTRAAVNADLVELAGYVGPWWPLAEMVLMRSHPGPRPTYDRLGSWPL
ncbi:2'-5' RNA ligase family protein [Polymorphospora rubra]|uniref:2'-5' RNA ligase family protein n=1 Tax=Polymorphospora rubra TaxID=338584 RepID=UPI0033D8CD8E